MEGLLTKNFPLNFVKISEIGYTDFPIEIYGKTWQWFEKKPHYFYRRDLGGFLKAKRL